jgi:hypothetical protein
MIPIAQCSTPGCGLRLGYNQSDGQICWFHADKQKLPAHRDWARDFAAFVKDFQIKFGVAATKRDNYGVLGR